jgi:hypothetical protein
MLCDIKYGPINFYNFLQKAARAITICVLRSKNNYYDIIK